ncbi:unnamed protein product [Aspergillus oryzae RIB40]|uniref:DNA, SC026 n=1 Tax=Aspergillus oryzae (strain ATCC 42149 / RIB 40) TaxID=510516 RepID=Q2UFL1_ASPOR|nr:unnamed protein product [Aspergillus oryzae RIB40]BAE59654.1 unnamed protein product [Aspergillus oryzae RIB40]
MASERDPRREPNRRRQSGLSHEQVWQPDTPYLGRHVAKTLSARALPRSQPILPSPEYADFSRYHGSHTLPFGATNEQPPLPTTDNSFTRISPHLSHPGLPPMKRLMTVFAVVWHEGMGNAAPLKGGTKSLATKSLASDRELMTVGKFGTKIYTDIRRMVVFKEQAQCAWCFPVHTYGRLGVAKASVDPSKHAIIYMNGAQPKSGPNEPRMTKEPLEVTPEPYQKLHAMSRLNFGKIYTVEHNQKVLPVGKISEESMAKFHLYAKRETELGY